MNKNLIKFFLDFIPLLLFFLSYKMQFLDFSPMIFASIVLTLSTIISMLIAKILAIKIEKINLYSNIAVILFGGLTIAFNNPDFIKIKLTILNGIFGLLLLFFYYKKKLVIKNLFQGKIELVEEKWNILNLRFSLMFFAIAILNVYFWQFTSEATWVNFKTFGVLPFIIIFFALQIRFIVKNGRVISN